MSSVKFNAAKNWFQKLRDALVASLEAIDNGSFIITEWDHKADGGGKMSKLKGSIIEKGGVNISSVGGKFEKEMIGKVPGTLPIISFSNFPPTEEILTPPFSIIFPLSLLIFPPPTAL